MTPAQLYEMILQTETKLTAFAYVHQPHRPRIADTEAKRQRRAKRRAINRRQLRLLKSSL